MAKQRIYQVDVFFMNKENFFKDSENHVSLACKGLDDLRKTIRCITPQGYRVRTKQWFSKYLKWNNQDLELRGGLFKTKMFRIREIPSMPPIKEAEYTGAYDLKHNIKVIL